MISLVLCACYSMCVFEKRAVIVSFAGRPCQNGQTGNVMNTNRFSAVLLFLNIRGLRNVQWIWRKLGLSAEHVSITPAGSLLVLSLLLLSFLFRCSADVSPHVDGEAHPELEL